MSRNNVLNVTLENTVFQATTNHGWLLQSITDWMSLSESKADIKERPQAYGAFDPGTDWRKSLAITLKVAWLGDSEQELEQAITMLNAIGALDRLVTLSVTTTSSIRTRQVSIRNIDPPDTHGRSNLEAIAIDMIAIDPRSYGPASSGITGLPHHGGGLAYKLMLPMSFGLAGSDGRARFQNTGSAPTSVNLTVQGGGTDGITLKRVENGATLVLSRPCNADDRIVFNSADSSVMLNDQAELSGWMTSDDFDGFDVQTGETCTVQLGIQGDPVGTPMLTLTAAPAYW